MIIRIPFLYTGLKNNQTDIQISIVSPLYNKVKYVKRGLESVLNQTYKNIEIIFVDDCSTDGSSEIVESYISKDPRLHLIKHNYNMGSAMARANGVLKSTGQYIFPFDPDDEIYLDAVETLLKLLKENNYPDILEFGCDALAVETGAIQRNWLSCVHSFHTRDEAAEAVIHSRVCTTIWKRAIKRSVYLQSAALIKKIYYGKRHILCDDASHVGISYAFTNNMICNRNVIYKYYIYKNNSGSNLYQKLQQNDAQCSFSHLITNYILEHRNELSKLDILPSFLNENEKNRNLYNFITNATAASASFKCGHVDENVMYEKDLPNEVCFISNIESK